MQAVLERNLIQERSAAGRVAAKARGSLGGRPEKYGVKDIEMMKALIDGGMQFIIQTRLKTHSNDSISTKNDYQN